MQAISMLLDAVTSGFLWFTQVFTAAGLMDVFSGLLIITLIMGRLVSPLLRASASDKAKNARKHTTKDGGNG